MGDEELFFKAETGSDAKIKRSYAALFRSFDGDSSEDAEQKGDA